MNFADPQQLIEVWYIFAIFYFLFCWGLPMLGMCANKWKDEAEGAERKRRYWSGVRFFSGCIHVSIILTFVLIHFLNPYLFPGA